MSDMALELTGTGLTGGCRGQSRRRIPSDYIFTVIKDAEYIPLKADAVKLIGVVEGKGVGFEFNIEVL